MVSLVTTFSIKDYSTIGKKFISNFLKNTKNINLYVVLDNISILEEKDKRIIPLKFEDPEYRKFLNDYSSNPLARGRLPDGRYEYRFDVVRFCHKVFAIKEAYHQGKEKKLLIWWDSDAFFTKKTTPNTIMTALGNMKDVLAAYLGRKDWDHSETGFIAFNLEHKNIGEFIDGMVQIYASKAIFNYNDGRTDSFVFDKLKDIFISTKGAKFKNISENVSGNDVWPRTSLSDFSVHYKGFEQKRLHGILPEEFKENQSVRSNNMQRYGQIYKLIEFFKPQIITEIGVAAGDRAVEMIKTALRVVDKNSPVVYFGFDLFEDIDEETSKKELNAKKVSSREEVSQRLLEIQEKHPNFFFNLYKGNTNQTLDLYVDEEVTLSNIHGNIIKVKPANSVMVFIDGGHSIETIQNDYEHFKNAPLIVLDDYYQPDKEGRCPDISKYGCNFLKDRLPEAKLLPIMDPIVDGGFTRLMVAGKLAEKIKVEEAPDNPTDKKNEGQVRIQTKNSIPNEELQRQVDYTCRMMKKFKIPEIPQCELHDTWAYMVGGSPSFKKKKYLDQLKKAKENNGLIFTSKTAHDFLIEKGIIPWACILLDPRPHVAKSFKVHQDVTYIVASQVHPDVIDYLTENTDKIMVYHAAVAAGEDEVIKKHFPKAKILPGGSTSQTRGLMVLMTMGFYKFKMFGIDSSYEGKPDEVHGINKEKKPMEITVNDKETGKPIGGKSWWVDPELVVQCNDMEYIMKVFNHIIIDCQSEGLMKALINHWKKNKEIFVSDRDKLLELSRKSTFE